MAWVNRLLSRKEHSKDSAKRRLKLVLMHDRATISPGTVDKMKKEILEVIQKYIDLDEKDAPEFSLSENQRTVALVANIPIKGERPKAVYSP